MTNYKNPQALVTTDWLLANLNNQNLAILDATWHLESIEKDAKADYVKAHIPGAKYFDIDHMSDPNSNLAHMLPSPSSFSDAMGRLGVNNKNHIVIYDAYGLFSAARVWWMFRIFGHDNVSILNGGSLKWLAENKPMTSDETKISPTSFMVKFRKGLVCDMKDMLANIESQKAQVLDARSRSRFFAKTPEPRPGLRSGHIPNSISLPFDFLLDETSKELLAANALCDKFNRENIHIDKSIICSCGSGITACVLALGLFLLGQEDAVIYDGSWAEWGASADTPIDI